MTLPFRTTHEQIIRLAEIVTAMTSTGLDRRFVAAGFELARTDQGIFELMELWYEADSKADGEETLADLQDLIDEAADLPSQPTEKPYVPFDGLDAVAATVMDHKKRLRELIDKHGGVTAVARKIGMPQPSLSRLLNSASMPRRTTLYRIANGLEVPESEVVGEWVQ
jgi:hypothetical protein